MLGSTGLHKLACTIGMHYSLFADVQMVSRYCPVTQEIPCAPAVTFHVRLKCSRSCRSGSFILITSSPACIAGYLDLLVHSPHQMVRCNIPKRLVVHQAKDYVTHWSGKIKNVQSALLARSGWGSALLPQCPVWKAEPPKFRGMERLGVHSSLDSP